MSEKYKTMSDLIIAILFLWVYNYNQEGRCFYEHFDNHDNSVQKRRLD